MAVLLVVLTACGANDVAERVAEASSGEDVDVTLGDDGSFRVSTDEGEMQLGVNERPDWLPSDFYLPPDLEIVGSSSSTETGRNELGGASPSLDADQLIADVQQHLLDAGYELLSEDEVNRSVVFAKGGIGLVKLGTTEGMIGFPDAGGLSIVIEPNADLDEVRLQYEAESVTEGEGVAVADGAEFRTTGECRIQGHSFSFTAGDGSMALQIDTSTTPVYAAGNVVDFSVDPPVFFIMDTTLPGGEGIESQTAKSGFSATGPMRNGIDTAQDPVPGSIQVTCG
ncbi:MAG: hypothetical protein WBV06_17125 [Acidimicrobiia bacterium]